MSVQVIVSESARQASEAGRLPSVKQLKTNTSRMVDLLTRERVPDQNQKKFLEQLTTGSRRFDPHARIRIYGAKGASRDESLLFYLSNKAKRDLSFADGSSLLDTIIAHADINAMCGLWGKGQTPLQRAALCASHTPVFDRLMAHPSIDLEAQDGDGHTALDHLCATLAHNSFNKSVNKITRIKQLLNAGAIIQPYWFSHSQIKLLLADYHARWGAEWDQLCDRCAQNDTVAIGALLSSGEILKHIHALGHLEKLATYLVDMGQTPLLADALSRSHATLRESIAPLWQHIKESGCEQDGWQQRIRSQGAASGRTR